MVSRSDVFLPFCHSKAGLVMAILVLCASGRMWSFASAGSEQERPTIDEADGGKYDNQDEVEEADHLQHLREAQLLGGHTPAP